MYSYIPPAGQGAISGYRRSIHQIFTFLGCVRSVEW